MRLLLEVVAWAVMLDAGGSVGGSPYHHLAPHRVRRQLIPPTLDSTGPPTPWAELTARSPRTTFPEVLNALAAGTAASFGWILQRLIMTIGYTIVPALRLVFVRAWGALTADQLRRLAEALRDDSRFRPDFSVLADLRPVTTIAISSEQVRQIPTAFVPGARRAVIATPSEAFGMARMYGLTTGLEDRLQVFAEVALALEWLGVDRSLPWPETFPDAEIGAD